MIINKTTKNYYNNSDYKIITIIYACLYNIIINKHQALLDIKGKGNDKYNFLGYYGKKNTFSQVQKLFGMFDLIMEITK